MELSNVEIAFIEMRIGILESFLCEDKKKKEKYLDQVKCLKDLFLTHGNEPEATQLANLCEELVGKLSALPSK